MRCRKSTRPARRGATGAAACAAAFPPLLVLALTLPLASAPARAELMYYAKASVDAVVAGQTTQQLVLVDPPSGGHRSDPSQVHAGREVFLSGAGVFGANIVAQAKATSEGSGNGLRAGVWSSQQQLNPFQFGTSSGQAEAQMNFTVTVLGAPGTSGTVNLRTRAGAGVTPAPTGGAARFSSANVSATASLLARSPFTGSCGNSSCFAQKAFGETLRDGAGLLGGVDLAWDMQVTANAGDSLLISLNVSARADNGYGVGVTLGAPWSGNPPFATAADGMQLIAADDATTAEAGALASLWLSPGLSLAPDAGLVQLADGSYGFAALVPEPSTWLLMAGGLLCVFRRAFRGSWRAA